MPYTIDFQPAGIRLVCDEPLTVAEAALRAGISLRADCGHKGACGKCRVRIGSCELLPPREVELGHLSAGELAAGWRLACRSVITGDTRVFIPDSSMTEEQVIQVEGQHGEIAADSAVRAHTLGLPPPSLDDQAADWDRLEQALAEQHVCRRARIGLPALRALRKALREGRWQVTVVLREGEVIAAYPGKEPRLLGLAVDVGTTKLACYLVDLKTGRTLAARGVMNPQIAYGEDVMSRLEAVVTDPMNAERQQRCVVEAINEVVKGLCADHDLTTAHIVDVCLVGNTAMHHLLLDLPVEPLGVCPFVPATGLPLGVPSGAIGLQAAPGAEAYLPPPIAGFVGSDHLAFLLATGFGEDGRTRLGLDIGTNTEIALQVGERIVSCSTASGPAFEGAHIRHGMRAAPGAIEHLTIDAAGQVQCRVIGDMPPVGICGSGVLDALAEMYRAGVISRRGRIKPDVGGVCREEDGTLTFRLAPGCDGRRDVVITQKDIEEVLLAKGAIRAGIDILMQHLGAVSDQLEEVVIGGAFGTYLAPANAAHIGLLPPVPPERIRVVGNAAGAGARMMLASGEARQRAERLARRIEYLELTVCPSFTRLFVEGTRMPN